MARATHEIRNPLNGAAVNLEVVRQRIRRGDAAAPGGAALEPFAEAAGAELERAIARTEALLALARPAPAPVDLSDVLPPLLVLFGAMAEALGERDTRGTATAMQRPESAVEVEVPAIAVRLAMVTVLERLVDGGRPITCAIEHQPDQLAVVFGEAARARMDVPAPVRSALAGAGIEIAAGTDRLTVTFPAVRRRDSH